MFWRNKCVVARIVLEQERSDVRVAAQMAISSAGIAMGKAI